MRGLDWERLAQQRNIALMCALYKVFTGERAQKAIGDRFLVHGSVHHITIYTSILLDVTFSTFFT
jgi:hypothetical protein